MLKNGFCRFGKVPTIRHCLISIKGEWRNAKRVLQPKKPEPSVLAYQACSHMALVSQNAITQDKNHWYIFSISWYLDWCMGACLSVWVHPISCMWSNLFWQLTLGPPNTAQEPLPMHTHAVIWINKREDSIIQLLILNKLVVERWIKSCKWILKAEARPVVFYVGRYDII